MSWYNDVQTDRQWIRRVMREEKHLVERMNLQEVLEKHGIPPEEAARVMSASKPGSTVSSMKPDKSISKGSKLTAASLRRAEESKRMDADLESVSRVSVATPKTASSATSIASRSQQSEIASSVYSSKSSQQRIQKLKKELEEEKRLRTTIEKELAQIQTKDIQL